jgi:hypothetical protein
METILIILEEVKHLESLVRLARQKNWQLGVYGFRSSNIHEDLHQQDAS